jgi:hypothetical protein
MQKAKQVTAYAAVTLMQAIYYQSINNLRPAGVNAEIPDQTGHKSVE